MPDFTDPNRHLGDLQQCLSSNKKQLAFFLGAGCPMGVRVGSPRDEPLIPDIAGLTRLVREKLDGSDEYGKSLTAIEEHLRLNGTADPTIEDILSHIRALREIVGKDTIRGLTQNELDNLDTRICDLIYEASSKALPNATTPYHQLAYWVGASIRQHPVEIFTTNYDLLLEQALEESHVPYFDGFAGSCHPLFDLRAMEEDILPSRWTRLWKLHGSINWYQLPNKGVFRGTPKDDGRSNRVIHPSHLKYLESRRLPYLALIDRLRGFVRQPAAALILCGYSFRDQHINEVLLQSLEYASTAVAFALLYQTISEYAEATTLALSRTNLNLLAKDGAIVGGQQYIWSQRDAGSVSDSDGEWITWTPVSTTDVDSKRAATFNLGDFGMLGRFLRDQAGTFHGKARRA